MAVRQIHRIAERVNCDIAVTVTVGLVRRKGRLVDVTPFGAQASMTIPYDEGKEVNIEMRGQTIPAKVMWTDGKRMGLRFAEQVVDGPLRKQIESMNASLYGNTTLPSMRRFGSDA